MDHIINPRTSDKVDLPQSLQCAERTDLTVDAEAAME